MNTSFLEPHQQGVVEQSQELYEKLERLEEFRTTEAYKKLSVTDRKLLSFQSRAMKSYLNVLQVRVNLFITGKEDVDSEGEEMIGTFGIDQNDEVLSIKFGAILLIDTIDDIVTDPRRKAIAKTHVEEAAMMAVKGIFTK